MDINYFKNRRTVRKFSEQQPDVAKIVELLRAASQAPTTGNMQLYSVVITSDKEGIRRLSEAHFNQPASTGAPMLITFCADFNRFEQWCRQNNAEPGYENFQSFMAASLDAAILCQQFNTIAELSGLGCCYLGTTTYNADLVAQVLELPDRVVPITTLAVGWPDETPALTDRIPCEGFIHFEKYTEYTDSAIADIYGYKEKLQENQKYIAENNKETLAQIFTDVRYSKANNEYFSEKFLNYIKSRHFM